jgi:hypothetical protein
MLLPELAHLRQAARILRVDACYHARPGSWETCLADIEALEGIAGHVGRDPFLISGLIALAADGMRIDAVENALDAGAPPGDLLRLVGSQRSSPTMIVKRAMLMEEALGLSLFGDLASNSLSAESLGALDHGPGRLRLGAVEDLAGALWRVFLLEDDMAWYRHYMRLGRECLIEPYGMTHKLSVLRTESETMFREAGLISRLVAPAYTSAIEKVGRAEAARRAALVGVAVGAHLSDGGSLQELHADRDGPADGPRSLDLSRLVPRYLTHVPADPFVRDARIKAVQKPDGSVVAYSVGPDVKDDGGSPIDRAKDRDAGDIVFTLSARMVKAER